MPEYPIQIAKVQAPPLRDETLARDRLLDWVGVKVHGRVVLVVAEAGYGKTTLLADFSRRTRIRTLWFRLDAGDRDWIGFLAYLVAAVRIHVPGFAPITDSLIRETSAAPPSRASVIDTFLRELGELPPDPIALILDDYHLVDDAIDIRHVVKELLVRAPERLSFVFLTRRTPPLPLARLRALGEVATLGVDDLRFDEAETERLFRETYEMKLEPALVTELSRRTEGWAASLQLVRAALRGRSASEVRSFIHALSGAEGDLYDYLAEEVVAELPDELQSFLMRTSLLETVDTVLGPVAGSVSVEATRRLIDEGERLGLFGRRGPNTRYQVRAHPLVRDFLQARLARSIGSEGMRAIHLAVAQRAEAFDWRIGTHHYRAAGHDDDARRVLTDSIETILGTGAYAAAEEVAASLEGYQADPAVLILRSRGAQQRGFLESGVALAEQAFAANPDSPAAILNLMTARTLRGDVDGALEIGALLENSQATRLSKIGPAFRSMIATSTDGSLVVAGADLEALVGTLRERGELHFLGVALSNWSYVLAAQGEPHLAYVRADEAVELLRASSGGIELVSALLARAGASAHLGDLVSARNDIEESKSLGPPSSLNEVAYEGAQLETFFGSSERALALLAPVQEEVSPLTDGGEQALVATVNVLIRRRELDAAARHIQQLQFGERRSAPAFDVRRRAAAAALAFLNGDDTAAVKVRQGMAAASAQGARLWVRYFKLLLHLIEAPRAEDAERLTAGDPALMSMAAEMVVTRLHEMSPATVEAIAAEASRRPERWREPLRLSASGASEVAALRAAEILEQIGELSDVPLLRAAGRRLRARPGATDLGRDLARRLAPRVVVEDLGRVRLRIGAKLIEGSAIRRRVLELLCFLLTKSKFASTREEALEALWPDLDPSSGLNSLNQTVYFLRRVLEPTYSEDLSPGYVGQDSEMVWLDTDLVDCRSRRCREMIRSAEVRAGDGILGLAREYRAKFALDFAYDDWSASFRDSLHASFLRVVEQAIHTDIELGHLVHATELAELALEVEPDAEELEISLLRLYRMTGAHAAAAERYAHYAMTLRGLGIEPPRLADV